MEIVENDGTIASKQPPTKQRLPGIDAARFLAILGVIWIHCCRSKTLAPTANFGRFAVPFFVITAIYFACRHAQRAQQSLRSYAISRVGRLYVPFLAWNLIYISLSDLKRKVLTHMPMVKFTAAGFLLNGFSLQLWFLPFILVVSIGSFAYGRLLCRTPHWRAALTAAAAVAAFLWPTIPEPHALQTGLQWYCPALGWAAGPSVLLGFSFFGAMQSPIFERVMTGRLAGYLGLAALAVGIAFVLREGRSDVVEALSGLALAVWAFSDSDIGISKWLAWFGPLTYGVYLVHAVFVEGIEAVAYHIGFGRTPELDVFNLSLTTTLSVVACLSLRNIPVIGALLCP